MGRIWVHDGEKSRWVKNPIGQKSRRIKIPMAKTHLIGQKYRLTKIPIDQNPNAMGQFLKVGKIPMGKSNIVQ